MEPEGLQARGGLVFPREVEGEFVSVRWDDSEKPEFKILGLMHVASFIAVFWVPLSLTLM